MPRVTVSSRLEKIRAARLKLEREEKKLMSRTHDKALSQIVQIARDAGLTAEQITAALGGKSRAKAAGIISSTTSAAPASSKAWASSRKISAASSFEPCTR